MREFSVEQFDIQKSISQLFDALKAIFPTVNLSLTGRSEQLNKTHYFIQIFFCDVITLHSICVSFVCVLQTEQAIRYLEFCIERLDNRDPAIHNYLLSLYIEQADDEALLRYLDIQGQVRKHRR